MLYDFVFMDFEASSLRDGYPVEVGWAWVASADVVASSILILPADEWLTPAFTWDPMAEAVHGLPLTKLQAEGQAPAHVCRVLNEQLQDKVAIFDTGPDGVDRQWLDLLFSESAEKRLFKLGGSADEVLKEMARENGLSAERLAVIKAAAPPITHQAAEDAAHYAWCAAGIERLGNERGAHLSIEQVKAKIGNIRMSGVTSR